MPVAAAYPIAAGNRTFVQLQSYSGRADVLVTHNVRHFWKAAAMFGLRVLQPGDLLKELSS